MQFSLKSVWGAVALVAGLGLGNVPAVHATCSAEPYLSTVCWTMATYCPRGYAEASGQLIAISSNQALFSLIGTLYGGNGTTTFALPDLRGRAAIGTGTGTGLPPVGLGQKLGWEDHMLTVANLPAHSHTVDLSALSISGDILALSDTGDDPSPGGKLAAARPAAGPPAKRQPYYSAQASGDAMALGAVQLTFSPSSVVTTLGAGWPPAEQDPLALRPPQATVLACIATQGIYPPRD